MELLCRFKLGFKIKIVLDDFKILYCCSSSEKFPLPLSLVFHENGPGNKVDIIPHLVKGLIVKYITIPGLQITQ